LQDWDTTAVALGVSGWQILPKPAVTCPLTGFYELEWTVGFNGTVVAPALAYMGVTVNAVADSNIVVAASIPAMNFQAAGTLTGARRTFSAGDALKICISPTQNMSATGYRTLTLKPLMVG
jgi:hypothetical protein